MRRLPAPLREAQALLLTKEDAVPYVNIKITPEGVSRDHKRRLIHGVTQLLVDVLDKDPNATMIVIDLVDTDDWGFKGQQVSALRRQEQAQ
jgi:4-oxalocrotonate tautomerase